MKMEIKTPTLEKLIELSKSIAIRLYAHKDRTLDSYDGKVKAKPIDSPLILWRVSREKENLEREDGSIAEYRFRDSKEDLFLTSKETHLVLGDNYWYPETYSHYPSVEEVNAMLKAEYGRPIGVNAYILGQIQLGERNELVCPVQYFKINSKDYKRQNPKRALKFAVDEVKEERKEVKGGN